LFTAHGWTFTEGIPNLQRTLYRQVERLAEPLAKRIICVSENDRQIGIATGMDPQRLVTIHNGMPDIPAELHAEPASGSPVRLVMIARFDHQKDHSSLLQALKSVPDVHLDLVGDGPNLGEMQALVQTLELTERVHFLGFRRDVTDILAKAHIFTLISKWEGFPRTTLEAMRAGLPVVVSDVGGAAEAIVEGQTGFCIPRGDVDRLVRCLSLLAKDSTLRAKLGKAAIQHYQGHFTFERMFKKTFQIYEEILASS
jgi:glycosyltransferase involved in cell wall biosynthesis